jgi:hypothetical protein
MGAQEFQHSPIELFRLVQVDEVSASGNDVCPGAFYTINPDSSPDRQGDDMRSLDTQELQQRIQILAVRKGTVWTRRFANPAYRITR